MKNILLPLVVLFTGCLVYEQPTYPTLDGSYILSSVNIDSDFNLNDTTYSDQTTVITFNPSTPLDTLKVKKTKIHISGNRMSLNENYDIEYPIEVVPDLISGWWSTLVVYFNDDLHRSYNIPPIGLSEIGGDGVQYLVLSYKQRLDSTGETIFYELTFNRQGP